MEGTEKIETFNWLEQSFNNNELKDDENALKCQQVNQPVTDENEFEILENNSDKSRDGRDADDNILQFLEVMAQSTLEDNMINFIDQDFGDLIDENDDGIKQLKQLDDFGLDDTREKVKEHVSEGIGENIKQLSHVDKSDLNDTGVGSNKHDSEGRVRADNTRMSIQADKPVLIDKKYNLIHHQNENIEEKEDIANLKIQQEQKAVCINDRTEHVGQRNIDMNESELIKIQAEDIYFSRNENREIDDQLQDKDGGVYRVQFNQDDKIVLEENRTERNLKNINDSAASREDFSDVKIREFMKQYFDNSEVKRAFKNEDKNLSETGIEKQYIDEYLDFVGNQTQINRNVKAKPTIEMLLYLYTTIENRSTKSDHSLSMDLNDNDVQHDLATAGTSVANEYDKTTTRYRCCICSKSYAREYKLKAHLYAHVLDKYLSCYMCRKRFNDRKSLEDHVYLLHRPYHCDLCSKRFLTKRTLLSHTKRHLYGQQKRCNLCSQYFQKKGDLLDHIRKDHNERFQDGQDIHVDNQFKGVSILKGIKSGSHELTELIADESHSQEFPELITNEVDSKEFPELISNERLSKEIPEQALDISASQEMNRQAPGYSVLQEMRKQSSSNSNYQIATEDHSKEVSKQITDEREEIQTKAKADESCRCIVCDKVFKSQRYLHRHMIHHSDYFPYTCSLCKKGFKRGDGLKLHAMSAHRKKSFQCDLCQKYYGSEWNLKIHKLKNCLNKHPCSFCAKRFKSVDDVFRHVKMEHPKKMKIYQKNLVREIKNLMVWKTPVALCENGNTDQVRRAGRNAQVKVSLESDRPTNNERVTADPDKVVTADSDKIITADSVNEVSADTNENKTLHTSEIICTEHDVEKPIKSTATEVSFQQNSFSPDKDVETRALKKNKVYKCTECHKIFSLQRSLHRHMSLHLKGRMFWCSSCKKCFPRNDCLQRHCLRYHPKKTALSCGICEKKFTSHETLEEHERSHPYMRGFLCCKCGIAYKFEYEYKNHIRRQHSTEESKADMKLETASKEFEIAVVELFKETLSKEKLVDNTSVDEAGKDYSVEKDNAVIIESMFEMKERLKKLGSVQAEAFNHKVVGQMDKEIKRACEGKERTSFEYKLQHNPTPPMGNNNFTCRICSKLFSIERNMIRHMNIHRQEKPYHCSVCKRGFSRSDGLKLHMLNIHETGMKSFKCKVCKKTFASRNYLKKHEIIHKNVRKFQCKVCMKEFKANCDLKKHLKRIHPDIEITHDGEIGLQKSVETLTNAGVDDIKVNEIIGKNYLDSEYNENTNAEGIIEDVIPAKDIGSSNADPIYNEKTNAEGLVEDVIPAKEKESRTNDPMYNEKTDTACIVENVIPAKDKESDYNDPLVQSQDKQTETEPEISCKICHKTFAVRYGLRRHMYTHSDRLPFSCSLCQKGFNRIDSLKIHMINVHTGEKSFECDICKKKFSTRNYLIYHKMIHSTIRKFQCKECEKTYKTKSDLDKHIKTKHLKTCKTLTNAGVDDKKVNEITGENYLDSEYNEKTNSENVVEDVIPKDMGSSNTDPIYYEKTNSACIVDNVIPAKDKESRTNDAIYNEKTNAACIVENVINAKDKESDYNDPLVQSQDKQTETESKTSCKICHKTFAVRYGLRRHMYTHSDRLPFSCSVCQKGFNRIDSLKIHMINVHTGEKSFECDICKKKFATRNYLIYHKMIHSTVRKFKCRECEKTYKTKSDLDKHIKKKHPKSCKPSIKMLSSEYSIVESDERGVDKSNIDETDKNLSNKADVDEEFEKSDQFVNIELETVPEESTGNVHDDIVKLNNGMKNRRSENAEVDERLTKKENKRRKYNINTSQLILKQNEKDTSVDETNRCLRNRIESNSKTFESMEKQKATNTKKSFSCSICQKVFAFQCGLRRHMVVHSEELPYACSCCGKRFPRKDSLHLHSVTAHNGKKDFECEICHKTFATNNYLKEHRRRHSSVGQFPCQFCDRSSKTYSDLLKHVQRKHPEKLAKHIPGPHLCRYCKTNVKMKGDLLKHVKRVHPEKLAEYKSLKQ